LPKFCYQCGKQNDDQAVFCIACGVKFPENPAAGGLQSGMPGGVQPTATFTAEMGPGIHKHILTDVFLKDASGKLVLAAKRQSLLHENYSIVAADESVVGFIEHKMHLTHASFSVQDANHNATCTVQVSNVQREHYGRAMPPNCWLEDAGGNRLGSVSFMNGLAGFSAVRPDGSGIFDAGLAGGVGLREMLSAMEHRTYTITLVDPGFSLSWTVALIVAVDQISLKAL
jgi:hypothetical protein